MSTFNQNINAASTHETAGESVSRVRSGKKFTFEDLMSGKTSFKSWGKIEEDGPTSNSSVLMKDQDEFRSLKQRWEQGVGRASSISPCSSIRSSESEEDVKHVGNILKKFQSIQVRSKPNLVSYSSFRPTSPTASEASVSSRKDMFNSMIKQSRKNERCSSIKSKSINCTSKKGEEEVEVESSYVQGRRAFFESMK
eukprot:TRINITY_DN693_c0_g2_i1.p2 TRINITY_DN693_c0_g2~~TRINITY_DN693_c0_g2_i1.p2  ORF type:complete len:196 (-),score=30.44 TRINITY_DN693_c0_g2_i1:547-1134(-)